MEPPGFLWKLFGFSFGFNLRLPPLGGFDVILGVDWMKAHNPILFDFQQYTLTLQRRDSGFQIQLLDCSNAMKLTHKQGIDFNSPLFSVCLSQFQGCEKIEESILEELQQLLQKYSPVFAVPKSLPPFRSHNHVIPLLPQVQPVNIRPYRYPHFQKAKIEKLVAEVLQNEVI